MTKRELLELLEGVPDDCVIIMSSDEEGNNFDTVNAVERGKYFIHVDGFVELTDADDPEGEDCVVLWPDG